jgi:glycerol kinase
MQNEKEIAITGVIGDQQAALVGQGCFESGSMKSTYGTGCFLMVNTKNEIIKTNEGLLTTVGYQINDEVAYALEGSIYSCGTTIQWLRDKMKFFESAKQSETFLNPEGSSNNVHFLPAFNGLAAPYWNSDVRAGFYGITQNSSIEDMVTAAFKSICYQTKDITNILEEYDISINSLLVDGGMTSNETFCQVLSDVLQKKILKPHNAESTALGACIVSQVGFGMNLSDIIIRHDKKITPSLKLKDAYESDYLSWKAYIENSIE